MVKVFCQNLTHRWLCFLRHLSRRKQDIGASTGEGGALVILKDSVRERSLCPPLSAGGAHDPALLGFLENFYSHFRIESLRSKVMVKVFCQNLTHRWLCFLRHLSRRKQDIGASTGEGVLW